MESTENVEERKGNIQCRECFHKKGLFLELRSKQQREFQLKTINT